MIASVHVSDVGVLSVPSALRTTPEPASTPGLEYAVKLGAAPLGGRHLSPPHLGRVGMIAFWEDDAALSRYQADHPMDGWHVRLEPVRIHGYHSTRGEGATDTWPGLPAETRPDPGGPAVVLTLARTRISQLPRFARASGWAAQPLPSAWGFLWGTALARPPIVATCSLWDSAASLEAYAYGRGENGHRRAMDSDRAKAFHHEGVFMRFHPYQSAGHLGGRNPLDATLLHTDATP
jgi:hypothetical protein